MILYNCTHIMNILYMTHIYFEYDAYYVCCVYDVYDVYHDVYHVYYVTIDMYMECTQLCTFHFYFRVGETTFHCGCTTNPSRLMTSDDIQVSN